MRPSVEDKWPDGVPEGCRVEVTAEDPLRWRTVDEAEAERYRCRWTTGPGHETCGARPVAALDRGRHPFGGPRRPSWWYYCGDHLYGRWIEGDEVVHYRIVRVDEESRP